MAPPEKRTSENIDEQHQPKRTKTVHSTCAVVDFCERHNIAFMPLLLEIRQTVNGDGGVTKSKLLKPDYLGYCPRVTDFDDNMSVVKRRVQRFKEHPNEYTHVAIDTRTIYQIDIDCAEYSDMIKNILATHPYTGSSTKEYGRHIFVQDPSYNAPNKRHQFKQIHGDKVELLAGQWAWCPIDMPVENADKDFALNGLGDMIETAKKKATKKATKKTSKERITPAEVDQFKKKIIKYVRSLPYEQLRKCEIGNFKNDDGDGDRWELTLIPPEGYCPAKHNTCNNNHNPSIIVTPHWCRIDCFNASKNDTSDCRNNALKWGLSDDTSKEIFEPYYKRYADKYGVERDATFSEDVSDKFFSDMFMHRDGTDFVVCDGITYQRNEYGIFGKIAYDLAKIVSNFFTDFLVNSQRMYHRLSAKMKKDEAENGIKLSKNKLWGQFTVHKRIRHRLTNTVPMQKIVKWIRSEITNELYADKLDSDGNLLGFDNGVIDLSTLDYDDLNAIESVRMPTNEEFVSMSCKYHFKMASDAECQEWIDIIRRGFDTDEEMDYAWKCKARCLEGNANPEEIANFEQGPGGDSKGVQAAFCDKALGDYCENGLSASVIVHNNKKIRDGHDINLWSARKARMWIFSELQDGEAIDMEQFKRYSGSDPIPARTHHQKEMSHFLAPPLFIYFNHLPKLKNNKEKNVIRRVRAKRYRQIFVTQREFDLLDEDARQTHHVLDDTLKRRMENPKVKCIMMTILLKYFKRFKNEGLIEPQSILDDTKWLLENTDAENDFKDWFADHVKSGSHNITKSSLLIYFNAENNTYRDARWFDKKLSYYGYSCKNTSGYQIIRTQHEWELSAGKTKGRCVVNVHLDCISNRSHETSENQ
jgi:phage/plasmid-associated DNA primase